MSVSEGKCVSLCAGGEVVEIVSNDPEAAVVVSLLVQVCGVVLVELQHTLDCALVVVGAHRLQGRAGYMT